ncbi:hypothetical protein F2P81_017380 [Scophthalmus maximus]|uniref:Uncharacterized protein n=1 Tax=Scophthalmus maximus TaxID=52904 RepID=A0A6A4SDL1_SCOMX|nr:hypothetical protein F2P81_017380 [Scophthalmus maximus]
MSSLAVRWIVENIYVSVELLLQKAWLLLRYYFAKRSCELPCARHSSRGRTDDKSKMPEDIFDYEKEKEEIEFPKTAKENLNDFRR